MTKILVTGVSSGIGRALVKKIISRGDAVWGVARRKQLLRSLASELDKGEAFHYSRLDISTLSAWPSIVRQLSKAKFRPDIVILNAAIFKSDYIVRGINRQKNREIFETNFFSNLWAVNSLLPFVRQGAKFIFIGSSSAFKGSGVEGVAYAASKAALASAAESLYLKYRGKYEFKIIHFGPVATAMLPLRSGLHFIISAERAADLIIRSIDSPQAIHYYPVLLFLFLRLLKLLTPSHYLWILSKIDSHHRKHKK